MREMILDREDSINLGLVAYYPGLEGGGNTLYDYSGNQNHGTINGAGWGYDRQGNPANVFDGVDDNVDVPLSVFNQSAGAWAAWVNIASIPTQIRIFSSTHSSGGNHMFRTAGVTTSSIYFYMGDGSDIDLVGGTGAWNLNEWMHICFTWKVNGSLTTLKSYQNGEYIQSSTKTGVPSVPDVSIQIGNWYTQYMDGRISDFRIYNRALSTNEVTRLYNEPQAGLVEAWGFRG